MFTYYTRKEYRVQIDASPLVGRDCRARRVHQLIRRIREQSPRRLGFGGLAETDFA
jgi:hypothetical protein